MDRISGLFLQALKAALADSSVDWDPSVTTDELQQVIVLARNHHILPMIYEAVYRTPVAATIPAVLAACRQATVQSVMTQAVKTEQFMDLNRYLRSRGLKLLVVKGIVCRSLYPHPDYRFSGDEDVLCGEENFAAFHQAMVDYGMEPGSSGLDSYEVPYRKDGTLYIELHKTLFEHDSDIFGYCNRLFTEAFQRSVEISVDGETVTTMGWTDHMLYLILHAFKHFLHSGFGIRQVCDMVLFAGAYGKNVDWNYVLKQCRGIRADKFAAAIFAIGEKYLGFSPSGAGLPRAWRAASVDPDPLLADLLCGGIYGTAEQSRVHSSNMTLNAVSADKKGKKSNGNLLRTVFPSVQQLRSRFLYLHRHPWLLPVAWVSRIFGYAKETITRPASSAAEVIRTGQQRVELLRQYDIID